MRGSVELQGDIIFTNASTVVKCDERIIVENRYIGVHNPAVTPQMMQLFAWTSFMNLARETNVGGVGGPYLVVSLCGFLPKIIIHELLPRCRSLSS